MNLILRTIHSRGGLARTSELLAVGIDWEWLRIGENYGQLIRPAKGWWASIETPSIAIEARRAGGRLGCISALAFLYPAAIPPLAGSTLHICVRHSASRFAHKLPQNSRVHWARQSKGGSNATVDELTAVDQARSCLGDERARELLQRIERTVALDRV